MRHTPPAEDESTPTGGLSEGRMHHLLGYQLAQATILTTDVFLRAAGQPRDLKPVEFTILQLVDQNQGVTGTKLARALAISTPAVTIWLDRLSERGLIERERSNTDRRAQHLMVTRKGHALVTSALQELLDAERQLLHAFSEGERHMLLELLQKVARLRKR